MYFCNRLFTTQVTSLALKIRDGQQFLIWERPGEKWSESVGSLRKWPTHVSVVMFISVHKTVQWQCAHVCLGRRQPVSWPRTRLAWWDCWNYPTGEHGIQAHWACMPGITRHHDRRANLNDNITIWEPTLIVSIFLKLRLLGHNVDLLCIVKHCKAIRVTCDEDPWKPT